MDKPIYNPTDTINYRAFPTTTGAYSTNSSVIIEFKNPQGIVIKQESQKAINGIFRRNLKLPEVVNEGTWELVARLDDSPLNTFVYQFEVKAHVLPSFEVSVKPRKKFFHIDDEQFFVDISANYLYGEVVRGFAYVVFGFEDQDKKRTNFPASFRRIELREGLATLKKSDIKATVQDIESLLDYSLYVRVTVFTTTGTDMAETEKSGIKMVKSPYKIHFTKTSKYFKPGIPFSVTIFVTNPDGSPADKIPLEVQPGARQSTTKSNGLTTVEIPTQNTDTSWIITVRTKVKNLPEEHQAQNQMTGLAYRSHNPSSKNLLYISLRKEHISAGDSFSVHFNYYNENPTQGNQITVTTYLIISKGKIIKHGSVQKDRNVVTAVPLTVTKEMIPSFRIVAYYTLPAGGTTEVVSDSVWVDVEDTCIGKLQVESLDRNTEYRPGKMFKLKVRGDPGATISLVAVDKAVFLLNDKNKLTQTKIWDEVEKHDIGCTVGGGLDSMGVFTDAGLLFKTSTGEATTAREDLHCPSPAKRKRRSVVLVEYKTTLESRYREKQLKRCCRDGLTDIPMDYTCERRSLYITEGPECVKAFLHCCKEITKKIKEIDSRTGLVLSRSQEENSLLSEDDIRVRTMFEESWLWINQVLPSSADNADQDGLSSVEISHALKDTITDWEILVISSSSTTGVCVAEPFDIRVKMKFFVDLKMPYSVIRNEQVEIKAILYNYASDPFRVQVELVEKNKENREICSLASNTGRFRQDINVEAKSSRVVPYTIIPLKIGNVEIEVRARVYGELIGDAVRKTLRILPEGVVTTIENTVVLNPSARGGKQIVQFQKENLDTLVPDTTPLRYITATGDVLEDTIRNAISGSALTSLIRMPGGCVEQNMASMVYPVIAAHYLDKSGEWESVGLSRREETIGYISSGYIRQMSYRNSDDSYPPYNRQKDSSTWLTAFVAKVFALAYPLTHIDDDRLCNPLKFLIQNKQMPDGSFTEDAPVAAPYHMGGLQGTESKATLTAFILIAMAEAKSFCPSSLQSSIQTSMGKAERYLKSQLPSLSRPYSVAISSYALALMDNPDRSFLERHLGNSGSAGGTQWKDGDITYTLEATGYALLAYLKMGSLDRVDIIFEWLVEHGNAKGGFGSTQSTMVVFQALAEYLIQKPLIEHTELNLSLFISGRSTIPRWKIEKSNYHVPKSEKINIRQNFTVEATGRSSGKLTVVTVYNARPKPEEKKKCKMFELEVNIEEAVAPQGMNKAYTLDIYMKYLANHDGRMTILDISLPTGCVPLLSSLENLKNRVDQYIQYYNMDTQLSKRGSLIIHLYKVLNTRQHLSITLIQEMQVGLVQPAAVTIYDYYASENRCTKFYHPNKKHAELGRICRGELCRCAEESCSALNKITEEITVQTRMEEACRTASYVYKVQVSEIILRQDYDDYNVVIKQIIKQGGGEVIQNDKRTFLSHVSCRESLNVRKGEEYLFIGRPDDTISSNKEGDPAMHILGSETWLEWWPHDQDCQTEEQQETCELLAAFAEELSTFGCPN
ncbi:complement C3 [Amia ocellicauda]|uniref:complement C3 n=1 Tax=Amia ocellicauda TaxID=2972642 RepID=UPI00346461E3